MPDPEIPEGLTLEEPPTNGSKNVHVRQYRSWLEANTGTSVRLPDFTGTDATKDAQATAAAFNRIDGMHASFQTIDAGKLARCWVVYDPSRPRAKRGASAEASG